MPEQKLMDLKDVCSIRWGNVELGGVEDLLDEENLFRVNHVYVECKAPLLIAAASVDLSSEEEVFGLSIVRDEKEIKRFREGPFHPHNAPKVVSILQIGGDEADGFVRGRKELRVSRKTWKDQAETSLVTMAQEVNITSGPKSLIIRADETVPMSLLVMWKTTKEAKGSGRN